MPNSQANLKLANPRKANYSAFEIIEEKMSVSSHASFRTVFHLRLGVWFVIWDLTIGISDLLA
jgi:hypothetical protein